MVQFIYYIVNMMHFHFPQRDMQSLSLISKTNRNDSRIANSSQLSCTLQPRNYASLIRAFSIKQFRARSRKTITRAPELIVPKEKGSLVVSCANPDAYPLINLHLSSSPWKTFHHLSVVPINDGNRRRDVAGADVALGYRTSGCRTRILHAQLD